MKTEEVTKERTNGSSGTEDKETSALTQVSALAVTYSDAVTELSPLGAPSAPNPPDGCKCGAERHGTDPQRCASGHTLPGAFMSTMHALTSSTDRLPPEFAHLAAELLEFEQASIADDGGVENTPSRRRSLHHYRARLHRRIVQLDTAIEIKGLFDKRGKLRVAWLQQLQALINGAKNIDSLLGLDRRARKVATLADVLAERDGD